jgi:hypothetical protein
MIMEFINTATLRQIAIENGLIQEQTIGNTHTHISAIAKEADIKDKILARKERQRAAEYNRIKGRMVSRLCLLNVDPATKLIKKQMDELIIYATGLKARSLDNKRKELLAYGVIIEYYNGSHYRIGIDEEATAEEGSVLAQ